MQLQIQPDASPEQNRSEGVSSYPAIARGVAFSTLKECGDKLAETTTALQKHLDDIQNRTIIARRAPAGLSSESDFQRLQEELDSVKQCLNICNQASDQANEGRLHVFEEISIEDDGQQVFVSTLGDLLRVKGVSAGNRTAQWFGSMTDASLQQISRDRGQNFTPLGEGVGEFEGRYGAGYKLHARGGRSKTG